MLHAGYLFTVEQTTQNGGRTDFLGQGFTPAIQGVGSGTSPAAGLVRLDWVEVAFNGGGGDKTKVSSPYRDLGIYGSLSYSATRIGELVTWEEATSSPCGGSTWVHYDFSSKSVLLDVNTKYYFAVSRSGQAPFTYTARSSVQDNWQPSYPGGGLVAYPTSGITLSEAGSADVVFRVQLSSLAVPDSGNSAMLGLVGLLGLAGFRLRWNRGCP